jgi:CRISPR-associated protein Cas1
MNRIIDISTPGTRLSIFNGCLRLESPERTQLASIPLPDLLAVIVAADAVGLTHATLAELARAGVSYIACDRKYMPCGVLMPYEANALQAERFTKQRDFGFGGLLWQQIILGKILNSASVLELWGLDSSVQRGYAKRIQDGEDASSVEALAAKDAFSRMFEVGFNRRDKSQPENARLNYGYTVLRSATARFICAAGLHPTFGIHHHNRYNAFALADDLMEPFRPFVDHLVLELISGEIPESDLLSEDKLHLSGGIFARWICDQQSRTLVNWIELSVRSWSQFIFGAISTPPAAPLLERPENFELGTTEDFEP